MGTATPPVVASARLQVRGRQVLHPRDSFSDIGDVLTGPWHRPYLQLEQAAGVRNRNVGPLWLHLCCYSVDFLLWIIRHTQRFPKNLRHSYTQRLEGVALEFQETILMANAVRGSERSQYLARADGRLLCLRSLLRLAYGLELLGGNQIKYAAERVEELGRLLGAWRKGTDRSVPAARASCAGATGTTA
jgi:hypothetical protein